MTLGEGRSRFVSPPPPMHQTWGGGGGAGRKRQAVINGPHFPNLSLLHCEARVAPGRGGGAKEGSGALLG